MSRALGPRRTPHGPTPIFWAASPRRSQAPGACRLRIADTVGIARPSAVADMVAALKEANVSLALEFHAHNDLGMATANGLSAAEAGVDALSVTVNRLGERAGNAALEQLLMALQLHPELTSCANG